MGDLKARIRAKFSRRNSTTPSVASSTKTAGTSATLTPGDSNSSSQQHQHRPRSNASSIRGRQQQRLSQHSPCPAAAAASSSPPGHADQTVEGDLSRSREKGSSGECSNGAKGEHQAGDMKAGEPSDGGDVDSPPRSPATKSMRDIDTDERHNNTGNEHAAQSSSSQELNSELDSAVVAGGAGRDSDVKSTIATGSTSAGATSSCPMILAANSHSATATTSNDQRLPAEPMTSTNANKLASINELPSSTSIISPDPNSSNLSSSVIDDSTDTGAIDSTTDDDDPLSLSHDLGTPTPRPVTFGGSTPAAPSHGFSSPSIHYHDTTTASASRFSTPQTPSTARGHVLLPSSPVSSSRPDAVPRRQSLIPARQTTLIRTLLSQAQADVDGSAIEQSPTTPGGASSVAVGGGGGGQHHQYFTMMSRKVWVRRPGASATMVTVNEDDVIDDVRDLILRKYGNSLGRQFDAPDLSLRIVPREQRAERTLGPEEPVGRTLDAYFPGGQSVDEALIIDVPLVRTRITPRASPRAGPPHAPHLTSAAAAYYASDDIRPSESGTDYFGPVVAAPHLPVTVTAPSTSSSHPHTISVLSTGQIPQIPSPGSSRARTYRERPERPRLGRQHTSSPTIINVVSGPHGVVPAASHQDQQANPAPAAPPLPTPPAPEATSIQRSATPPPSQQQASALPPAVNPTPNPQRVGSPRPTPQRTKKSKKSLEAQHVSSSNPGPGGGMTLGGSVPPINVLIVEDNIINLKLLEAFVKRLKVRWQTAMNGRDAVTKWRTGGFHLVLMDIQLPVMSGLDATREIRRLERVNGIGVFSSLPSSASSTPDGKDEDKGKDEPAPVARGYWKDDKLPQIDMFKSPVIIVALTASSLQSDRHEALAAGCNDFLTKPVNFVWLERKVMEWGCMQALIDFDGWRKWKDFQKAGDGAGSGSGGGGASSSAAGGTSSSSAGGDKAKAKAKKRQSLNTAQQPQAITAGGDA